MALKPLQTAKRVGVRWTPSPEMTSRFIEPLVNEKHYDFLRREGRIALHSATIDDFNGMHVGQTAQFDESIGDTWQRRDHVRATIDDIRRTYLERANMYRVKYHLEAPNGEKQQRLIGRSTLISDSVLSESDQARYKDIQESVFFDIPAPLLPVAAGEAEDFLEERMIVMRAALADRAIRAASWLSEPSIYIETYRPHEAMKLAELLDWHRTRRQHSQN